MEVQSLVCFQESAKISFNLLNLLLVLQFGSFLKLSKLLIEMKPSGEGGGDLQLISYQAMNHFS